MVDPAAHYDNLLAEHYSWMLGDDVEALATTDARYLASIGVDHGALAVDLGCGPGPQTYALADLGFHEVISIDSSSRLLSELEAKKGNRTGINTVEGDLIAALPTYVTDGSADAVVCMRDTLLHLPDRDAVAELFRRVRAALSPGGRFVLTYRDMSEPLRGLDRFIPTRSDNDRIMMCVLDYPDEETAVVNDLVYTRDAGEWVLHKSSYPKLRLSPDWIASQAQQAGLRVDHHEFGATGMWTTVGHAEPAQKM